MPVTILDWFTLIGSVLGALIIAIIFFRTIVFKALCPPKGERAKLEAYLLRSLEKPFYFAAMLVGLRLALEYTDFKELATRLLLVEITVILLVAYSLFKLVDALLAWYREEFETNRTIKKEELVPTARKIAIAIVIAIVVTMLLGNLGIEITPILAVFGIGGLAIALALQGVLSNFLAGFSMSMDRSIKMGDFIELENGTQGNVVSIGWRSTQIRTPLSNIAIIPNNKLARIITTNYSLPTSTSNVAVPCQVAYGSNLEKVEKITLAAARDTQRKTKGTVPEFDPFVRYDSFGKNGVRFFVLFSVQEVSDKPRIIHEFIKELYNAYAKNGIEIPISDANDNQPAKRKNKLQ